MRVKTNIFKCIFLIILICMALCCRKKHITDFTECNEIADAHWFKAGYTGWLIDSLGIASDTTLYFDPLKQEWIYLSHHLPDTKTEQYYEMIGKYDQFRWGWDDYSDYDKGSVHREEYLECRNRKTK
jgi:hypothetical protein